MFHQDNGNLADWSNDLKQYKSEKQNLEWGYNPKPYVITSKMISKANQVFNPILQSYNNQSIEQNLKIRENSDLINLLAKNKVKIINNYL